MTDSFSGIRMLDVPGFVIAQTIGAVSGYWISGWLIEEEQL
jgi:hypothetical protein